MRKTVIVFLIGLMSFVGAGTANASSTSACLYDSVMNPLISVNTSRTNTVVTNSCEDTQVVFVPNLQTKHGYANPKYVIAPGETLKFDNKTANQVLPGGKVTGYSVYPCSTEIAC